MSVCESLAYFDELINLSTIRLSRTQAYKHNHNAKRKNGVALAFKHLTYIHMYI